MFDSEQAWVKSLCWVRIQLPGLARGWELGLVDGLREVLELRLVGFGGWA